MQEKAEKIKVTEIKGDYFHGDKLRVKHAGKMNLKLSEIKTDGGTQTRERLDRDIIKIYSEEMLNEIQFPDIVVFYDGSVYWLADGFHRVQASALAGFVDINAEVKQGTRRDAVLYSVGANSSHGLRRTNADKRIAVMALLEDAEWGKWSDREIARRCCVSHDFVNRLRPSLSLNDSEKTFTTKHGTVATMNTTNIGKTKPVESKTVTQISIPERRVQDEEKKENVKPVLNLKGKNTNVELYDSVIQIISFIEKKTSMMDLKTELEVYNKVIISLQNKTKSIERRI